MTAINLNEDEVFKTQVILCQNQIFDILNTIPTGISITTDISCQNILHNPVAAEFLRVNAWQNFSHSAVTPPSVQLYQKGRKLTPEEMPMQRSAWYGQKITGYEIEFVWEDGVQKISRWNSSPLKNEAGIIIGAVATVEDITQRRRLEKELKLHHQHLDELVKARTEELNHFFDLSLDAFMIIGFDGIIRRINPVFAKNLGYDPEELAARSISEIFNILVHPEDRENTVEQVTTALTGKPIVNFFNRVRSKNGSYNYLSWTVKPNEKKGLMYAVAHDITKQKLTETDLKISKEKISHILESITDSFFAVDRNFRVIYANNEALRHFRTTKENFVGHHMSELFPNLRNTVYETAFNKAMLENKPVHLELNSIYDQNNWIELHFYPSQDGISICFRDITQKKRMENEMARLDRLNMVGEMAAGIGHEVRNPMTTVKGFLQLLARREEFTGHREIFNIMLEELDRANSIITEFLSLAKNKVVKLKPRNLSTIVQTLYPLLNAGAIVDDKYIKTALTEVPDLFLDEKEIRQLLLNLVRNGLEAMPAGEYITIRTYQEGEEVVLAVEDRGSGIPPEIAGKLGTPFFTTKDHGTGLGLAVCYSIAARHKATIDVRSDSSGATFYVRFKK